MPTKKKSVLQATPILRAEIDTDVNPRLPCLLLDTSVKIQKHNRQGKIVIEKRADGCLYINGKKVVLFRSVHQVNGERIVGYELRTELDGQPVLSASILDFLKANWEYIPEEWKSKEDGKIINIMFWGTLFIIRLVNSLCVRCLYWYNEEWHEIFFMLDTPLGFASPAAMLEN